MTHQHNWWCVNRVKSREMSWVITMTLSCHGCQSWHGDDTPHWGRSSLSHGIFDHIIVALFNIASCLWNCVVTLCTESAYVIPMSKWCGTFDNYATILSTENSLIHRLQLACPPFRIPFCIPQHMEVAYWLPARAGSSIFPPVKSPAPRERNRLISRYRLFLFYSFPLLCSINLCVCGKKINLGWEQLQHINFFFSPFSFYRRILHHNFSLLERCAPADWFFPFPYNSWVARIFLCMWILWLEKNE